MRVFSTGESVAKKLKSELLGVDEVVCASKHYLNRSDLPDKIAYTGYVRQNVAVGMKVRNASKIGIVLKCDGDYLKVNYFVYLSYHGILPHFIDSRRLNGQLFTLNSLGFTVASWN
jgi:hypothetical protein